jgi:glycosyltransferase involved in cell wall biosynthesis
VDPLEDWFGAPFPVWGPFTAWRLLRAIRDTDVVHVHDYIYLGSLIAAVLARWSGKPVVVTQHIGSIPYRSRLARRSLESANRLVGRLILGRADAVVFVGSTVRDYFKTFTRFRTPPRLIANGVDHAIYRADTDGPARQALRRKLGLDDHRITLLFVGRFVEKKGLHLLEHAARRLQEVDWIMIGRGPLSPRSWGLGNVRVIEGLLGSELVPWYQAADLLVLPSAGEGFPMVVQESLACGTPVAVSPEVTAAFPAIDPACVATLPIDDVVALASALDVLVRNPDWLASGREPARILARQWSWDTAAERYLDTYHAAVALDRGPA